MRSVNQYVYAETDNGTPELYDTQADPYQISNLVNDPTYRKVVKRLKKRLHSGNF